MNNVFISYSHKDEAWKERVVTHLGVLAQDRKLQLWDDRRIAAGDDWLPEIKRAIQGCDVALLLISADFLTSNFIVKKEIPALLQRRAREGVRVIPVILRPSAWVEVSWLKGIQARPKDGTALTSLTESQAEEALAALALEILGLGAGRPEDKSPEGDGETAPADIVEKQRRIDAVVPAEAKRNENLDLFLQVRFASSEPLGIEDWPLEKPPTLVKPASETVNLSFPSNTRTGKLKPARLRVVVVTPDFEVQNGPERLLEVPPSKVSNLVSFLLKPLRAGECRINVEVYDLGKVLLGTVPLETSIGIGARRRVSRVAQLELAVEVDQGTSGKRAMRRRVTAATGTVVALLACLFVWQTQFRTMRHSALGPVYQYAADGDVQALARELARKPAELNRPDEEGLTALHWAARYGRTNVVWYLVDKGADVNLAGKDGLTALHLAAQEGRVPVVEMLVTNGAKVNARDKRGRTPLDFAEQWQQLATADKLRQCGAIQ